MAQISDQIDKFREFALARSSSSNHDLSLDELYDEWRLMNPDPEQLSNDTEAVNASLQDYRNGIQGKPVDEVIRK